MDISSFSRCLKDLIVDNDKVGVPFLGYFMAEMVPAKYSFSRTVIYPPQRVLSFREHITTLKDCDLLVDKVSRDTGVSMLQAAGELRALCEKLCKDLEQGHICELPGIGIFRLNSEGGIAFTSAGGLDIFPEGIALEPVFIKEVNPDSDAGDINMSLLRGNEVSEAISVGDDVGEIASAVPRNDEVDASRNDDGAAPGDDAGEIASAAPRNDEVDAPRNDVGDGTPGDDAGEIASAAPRNDVRNDVGRKSSWKIILWVLLGIIGAGILFIVVIYCFADQLAPFSETVINAIDSFTDSLLYSEEELRLLGK